MGMSIALADIDWNAAKEVFVNIEVHLVLRAVYLGWLSTIQHRWTNYRSENQQEQLDSSDQASGLFIRRS
jgi:hypothetical protein